MKLAKRKYNATVSNKLNRKFFEIPETYKTFTILSPFLPHTKRKSSKFSTFFIISILLHLLTLPQPHIVCKINSSPFLIDSPTVRKVKVHSGPQ